MKQIQIIYKFSCLNQKSKKQKKILSTKKDNKYFQYVLAVVLNYEEIKKYLQRITELNLS